jgi:hypothetical protein
MLVEELFRKYGQDGGDYLSVKNGLEQLMPMLEHNLHEEGVGGGKLLCNFSSSFIATDNMGYVPQIQALNKYEDAIVKRFLFLRLCKESCDNGKRLKNLDRSEVEVLLRKKFSKIKMDLKQVSLFFKFIRKMMQKRVLYDEHRIADMAESIVKKVTDEFFPQKEESEQIVQKQKTLSDLENEDDSEDYTQEKVNYIYQNKLRGYIKSIVVLNSFIRAGQSAQVVMGKKKGNDEKEEKKDVIEEPIKKKIIPTNFEACEADYKDFELIFHRLTHDHFKIMTKKVGIKRDPKRYGGGAL